MLHRTELGAGFISHQSILTHPCLLEGHQKARIERQAKSSLGSVTFRGITHRPDSAISSHFHLISPDSRLTSADSLPQNTTKPKALLPSPPEGNRNPSSTHTHPPQGHAIRIVTLPCMNTHRHRHTDKRLVQASQPPPPLQPIHSKGSCISHMPHGTPSGVGGDGDVARPRPSGGKKREHSTYIHTSLLSMHVTTRWQGGWDVDDWPRGVAVTRTARGRSPLQREAANLDGAVGMVASRDQRAVYVSDAE